MILYGTQKRYLLTFSADYKTIIKTIIANQTMADAARNILNLSSLIFLFILIYKTGRTIATK